MSNYSNYLGAKKCCDLRGLGTQGPQLQMVVQQLSLRLLVLVPLIFV
jgi:hypothetical protein